MKARQNLRQRLLPPMMLLRKKQLPQKIWKPRQEERNGVLEVEKPTGPLEVVTPIGLLEAVTPIGVLKVVIAPPLPLQT